MWYDLRVPRSVDTLRRCPQCGNTYIASNRYFYQRGDGRLEYCQGPGTQECHSRYWEEQNEKRRVSRGQRFGVEIEFVGDRARVAEAINEAGIRCDVEDYNHRTARYWKVVTDASVVGGGELVSPPLVFGDRGIARVRAVAAAASTVAGVDRTCGLHVHCEVRGYKRSGVMAVVRSWIDVQDYVKELVHRRRRNYRFSTDFPQEALSELRDGLDFRNLNRYYNLNVAAYPKYGTIEIRLRQGSLNHRKIVAWVEFCHAFVDWGRVAGRGLHPESVEVSGREDLLNKLLSHGLTEESRSLLLRFAQEYEDQEPDDDDETLSPERVQDGSTPSGVETFEWVPSETTVGPAVHDIDMPDTGIRSPFEPCEDPRCTICHPTPVVPIWDVEEIDRSIYEDIRREYGYEMITPISRVGSGRTYGSAHVPDDSTLFEPTTTPTLFERAVGALRRTR